VTAAGLYIAIGLSVLQILWIVWAAIVFGFAPQTGRPRHG
jgi:hypothetical protein